MAWKLKGYPKIPWSTSSKSTHVAIKRSCQFLHSCSCCVHVFVAFSCCRCWSLNSFEWLDILLVGFIYSNASWSIRSSYVWSVAVLWEPRICRKKKHLFVALWRCIFQLIQEAFYNLYSAEEGVIFFSFFLLSSVYHIQQKHSRTWFHWIWK